MSETAAFRLPYAPELFPMPSCGSEELKRSLDYLVMPGDLLFERGASDDALRACRLTGGGVLASAYMGRSEVRHDNDHVRQLTGDDVVVLIALEGEGAVTQQGCTLPFAKGDITFRRARVPSVARIDEPAHLLMIRLPIARFLGQAVSRHALFRPQRASAASGIVRSVQCFVDQVLPSFGDMSPVTVGAAEEALVALLAAAYREAEEIAQRAGGQDTAGEVQPARWAQLARFIGANLCDPELDVEACGHALGVSKRYIHKLFEARDLQYGRYVLQERLARCRDELLNPLLAGLSIEQIAYRNGFNDAAHFSKRFRSGYGVSPREYRKRETPV
jgi:AraC family transcriptional regulator, positive regulator of tynA and feaB